MWRAESLLSSIIRYSGSTSNSSNQLVWNDEWLQRHIEHAIQTSSLLEKNQLGTHLITAQNIVTELENIKTMLATIKDDLPQGRLRTGIKCEDGTEVAWSELIGLKNESYSTVPRELVIGARMDVMIAIQGVREGTVAGGTLKIDTPYSHVGIADDLLFEGEAAYYPILMTIDGVTRPASLKEAWDPNHLEAIEIDLASVKDKSISRLLTASRRYLCKRRAVDPSNSLAIDTKETPLDSYATMETAQLGLDEIMLAQKEASAQLIKWCDTWQTRMEENPTDKVTLGKILKEAARRAPLFRRYKLFVIRVNQLREMRTHVKNPAAKKSSTPSETKTSFEMETSDQNLMKLEDSVSAAMAMQDDAWLQKWLDSDKYGDFSRLAHDGTVAPLGQSNVDLFTGDFDTLTRKMSIPQIWRLLSEDQRQRIRVHFPIAQETSTLEVGDEKPTAHPVVPITRKGKPQKKTKKQSAQTDPADDDRLIQEAIEEVNRDRHSSIRWSSASRTDELFEAAEKGECYSIPVLIKEGAVVDRAKENGNTALIISSAGGHEHCVLELLKAGASLDSKNKDGFTSLMISCQNGHEQCARELIKVGAAVNAQTNNGFSALMLSCQNGHEQCARELIKVGADIEKPNNNGWTPLMKACSNGHDRCVRALIMANANLEAKQNKGFTALMLSCENGHEQVARALLDAGATVDAVDNRQWTALMFAARCGHDMCARVLIMANANLDAKQIKGFTALMLSCEKGHEQVARALLEAKANIEEQNNDGMTALHWACTNCHDLCTLELLKAGANLNAADKDGWTALMQACDGSNEQCVRELIKAGADIEKPNNNGWTPLMKACSNGHDRCARELIMANANLEAKQNKGFTALMLSCEKGHEQVARTLLEAGATVDATEAHGATSLLLACGYGHLACTRLLIDAKADINHTMHSNAPTRGFTPLIAAANNGHDSVVQTLIGAGATIDATNVDGFTALMFAAKNGHIGSMRLLIKNGADPSHQATPGGLTAMNLAQTHDQKKAVKLLELSGLATYF